MTDQSQNSEKNESGTLQMKESESTEGVEVKTTSWHSYPKVYNLGHKAVKEILYDDVIVEEKIDGSQFSFGKFVDAEGTEFLRCRSKGVEINLFAPEKMFQKAIDTAQRLFSQLNVGWTYRGEFLASPHHNVLSYDRAPEGNIILFDINDGNESYLSRLDKEEEAYSLGLEIVPILFKGKISDVETFRKLLDTKSILGGQKVEGVVVKNYSRFTIEGKAMFGKFVSETFKEIHNAEWKGANPKSNDILETLISRYRTPARWAKAVQHLKELGQLENSPKDIGKLLPEIVKDTQEECEAEIRDLLFKWAWSHVRRGITGGFPEWYKEQLLKSQFETGENNEQSS